MPVYIPHWCAVLDCSECQILDECHNCILKVLEDNCVLPKYLKQPETETTTIAIYYEYCQELARYMLQFSDMVGATVLRKVFISSGMGLGEPSPQRIILDMINHDDEKAPTNEAHILRMKLNSVLLEESGKKVAKYGLTIGGKTKTFELTEKDILEASLLMKNWGHKLVTGVLKFKSTNDPRKCTYCPIRSRCKYALKEALTLKIAKEKGSEIEETTKAFMQRIESKYINGFAEYALAKYLKEIFFAKLRNGFSSVEISAFRDLTKDSFLWEVFRERKYGISTDYISFILETMELIPRVQTYLIIEELARKGILKIKAEYIEHCDNKWLPLPELWVYKEGILNLVDTGKNSKTILEKNKAFDQGAIFFDQLESIIDDHPLVASMDILSIKNRELSSILIKERGQPKPLIHKLPLLVYPHLILPLERKEKMVTIRRLVNQAKKEYPSNPLAAADLYRTAGYYTLYGLANINKGQKMLSKAAQIYADLGKFLISADSYALAWQEQKAVVESELIDQFSLSEYDPLLLMSAFGNVIKIHLMKDNIQAAENLVSIIERHINVNFPELLRNPVATSSDPYIIVNLALIYRDLAFVTAKNGYYGKARSLLTKAKALLEHLNDWYLHSKVQIWLLQIDSQTHPLRRHEYYEQASKVILEDIWPNEDLELLQKVEQAQYFVLQGWQAVELMLSSSFSKKTKWFKRASLAFRHSVNTIRSVGCPIVLYPETLFLLVLFDIVYKLFDPQLRTETLLQIKVNIKTLAQLESKSLELKVFRISENLRVLIDSINELLSFEKLSLRQKKSLIEKTDTIIKSLAEKFEPSLLGLAIQEFVPRVISIHRSEFEEGLMRLYAKAEGERRRLRGETFEEFLASCFRGQGFTNVTASLSIGGHEIDVYSEKNDCIVLVEAKSVLNHDTVEDIKCKKFPLVPSLLKSIIEGKSFEYWVVSPTDFPNDLKRYLYKQCAENSWRIKTENSDWLLKFITSIDLKRAGMTNEKILRKVGEFEIKPNLKVNVARVLIRGEYFLET